MAAIDLEAYLARIGYAGSREPSLRTLTGLHQAHVTAVPFENLDILLGRGISLDLGALQAKIVAGRRGGYCFEQNTLFQAVLETLGFRVVPLAARVRAGMTGVRPRTHMLLRVELGEGPYLADVGFGGDGLVHPLSFAEGSEVRTAGVTHRLRREDDLWVLATDTGGDLYAFTLEPQHPVDYEMANHYTSTWPGSKFVLTLTAQRSWPEGRAIVRNRDLTVRRDGAVRTETIRDPEHLLEVLEREFGLSFPASTRFSRPELSMDATDVRQLRRAIELARLAREHGNQPFGSLLVSGSGQVLAEHENVVVTAQDVTGHPESTLVRWAGAHLSPAERARATVYTSCEHCPMCAAATYWSGIGRIVFALSGERFRELLPPGAPYLSLGTRELFARGNRAMRVEGPCPELEAEALAVHEGFWGP